ncbi:MAG: DNA repair protein RecO [Verrucomicrobia bacterium]|nr:DNA repair protein RecO [Verrucomicrobiota bacterium]
MDCRANGIILRTRPLTETSLIVQWLTPDLGRIATVAKGARRPKSPFRGKLDLFYECEFSFARSRRSELHALREVTLRETHSTLRKDLGWLEQASYAAALVEQTTETETPLDGFYELFSGFITALVMHPPQPQTVFAFELKLLGRLGLQPDPNASALTPGSRAIVQKLIDLDWAAMVSLKPSMLQSREIQQFLGVVLNHHTGRPARGRESALALNS